MTSLNTTVGMVDVFFQIGVSQVRRPILVVENEMSHIYIYINIYIYIYIYIYIHD
jgi:hypothetical protein